MNDKLERFRSEATRVGPAKAGRKFPKTLIALGAEYANERRQVGASWQVIADELGIAVPTVQRWCERMPAALPAFERVAVVEERPRNTFTASVGALRIDGLDFEAIVALARALS